MSGTKDLIFGKTPFGDIGAVIDSELIRSRVVIESQIHKEMCERLSFILEAERYKNKDDRELTVDIMKKEYAGRITWVRSGANYYEAYLDFNDFGDVGNSDKYIIGFSNKFTTGFDSGTQSIIITNK